MISTVLAKLFSKISYLKGVCEVTNEALKRLDITRIIDLIWHLPVSLIQKKYMPNLSEVQEPILVIMKIKIVTIDPKPISKVQKFTILCSYGSSYITLIYFHYYPSYLVAKLKVNHEYLVSGKLEKNKGQWQIAHPDAVVPVLEVKQIEENEVIYPLTYGINNKQLTKLILTALDMVPDFNEWHTAYTGISFKSALIAMHKMQNSDVARQRLAYDEIFAHQLSLMLIRKYKNKKNGNVTNLTGTLTNKLFQNLEFTLTAGQLSVISEIKADQQSPLRMMRLLQGDVGSGKTIVALFTMLNAIESGKQACIMAPTDILATQHLNNFIRLVAGINVRIELLAGRIKGTKRAMLLEGLANGEIDILVGTHAVFQENVHFKDLGLVVIDEQHRFGVEQRLNLIKKGQNIDVLVMSATPIPRTLTMIHYNDMDISKLTEKPQGRIQIKTSLLQSTKENELMNSLAKLINERQKVYWICPLIEEQEEDIQTTRDLTAAITRFEKLNFLYNNKVGLIHGKMTNAEKESAMNDFANGVTSILVATTVIEVGIDVPDATLIVIEQAECFGLSQLHQLRGRVGRGNLESYCILFYSSRLSNVGKEKLRVMKEEDDGFKIAEEDLKLRGPGELLGTKQSGSANFHFFSVVCDQLILEKAANEASKIITEDPRLQINPELKNLLYLFGYHEQVGYIDA